MIRPNKSDKALMDNMYDIDVRLKRFSLRYGGIPKVTLLKQKIENIELIVKRVKYGFLKSDSSNVNLFGVLFLHFPSQHIGHLSWIQV